MTMRHDEQIPDPEDIPARTGRRSGNTDRLKARADDEAGTPLRRDWRSSRSTNRPARRATGLPGSWQEFVIWLQHGGGLKYVLGGLAVFFILLVVMVLLSRGVKPMPSDTAGATLEPQPTVTPALGELATPALLTQTGAQFRVTGTDTEGLFLRPDHSAVGAPITTLPEGTIVTVIGQDVVGPDRVWKNVRTAEGLEGWVASDFVKPVQ